MFNHDFSESIRHLNPRQISAQPADEPAVRLNRTNHTVFG